MTFSNTIHQGLPDYIIAIGDYSIAKLGPVGRVRVWVRVWVRVRRLV